MQNRSKNLIDLLVVITKWRWFLIKIFFISTAIGVAIAFAWPKTYKAESVIIPPVSESSGITSIMGGFKLNLLGDNLIKADNYETIIYSTTMKKKLIEKFNLTEVYGTEKFTSLSKALEGNIEVDLGLSGGFGYLTIFSLKIIVLDDDPERAQEMNKFIVEELNTTIAEANMAKARNLKLFLEKRYNSIMDSLIAAEDSIASFQKTTGFFSVSNQLDVIITAVTQLKSEIMKKEIELELLAINTSKTNPNYIKTKLELETLKRKYKNMFDQEKEMRSDLYLPITDIPDHAIDLLRLKRNVTLYTTMLDFIVPQFEQAKIQEQKSIPTFHIPRSKLFTTGKI
jgi:tyrosine-protein kinase Etk/Wzc